MEDLLGVVDDAPCGAFVEVGACTRRLAEEGGEFFSFGFEFGTFLLEGGGLVSTLAYLVGQLDRLHEDLFHYVSHLKRFWSLLGDWIKCVSLKGGCLVLFC